jgi:osmotically inducible lipoprotein OsmB
MLRQLAAIGILAAAAGLNGCATPGEAGAVTGAVIGGVAGHAIGGGTAGTVIGAGAGALIGNRLANDYYGRGYYAPYYGYYGY